MDAEKTIETLQLELQDEILGGAGPFLAAVFKPDGTLVAKASNSVLRDGCSNCHAEMNAIREAERILGTHDLSRYDLSIFVTSEPCIMCAGAIMWSGIRHVYYGVPSKRVEELTGFDEGFKPDWIAEFAKRGIEVKGGFACKAGEDVLAGYVASGRKVYKPDR
ncbi:MAG: nucleoside deaminase [Kiritimatiellae bacterium]|nr:nucleoside deaminase [Kiritimatiellia bacterium]